MLYMLYEIRAKLYRPHKQKFVREFTLEIIASR